MYWIFLAAEREFLFEINGISCFWNLCISVVSQGTVLQKNPEAQKTVSNFLVEKSPRSNDVSFSQTNSSKLGRRQILKLWGFVWERRILLINFNRTQGSNSTTHDGVKSDTKVFHHEAQDLQWKCQNCEPHLVWQLLNLYSSINFHAVWACLLGSFSCLFPFFSSNKRATSEARRHGHAGGGGGWAGEKGGKRKEGVYCRCVGWGTVSYLRLLVGLNRTADKDEFTLTPCSHPFS